MSYIRSVTKTAYVNFCVLCLLKHFTMVHSDPKVVSQNTRMMVKIVRLGRRRADAEGGV